MAVEVLTEAEEIANRFSENFGGIRQQKVFSRSVTQDWMIEAISSGLNKFEESYSQLGESLRKPEGLEFLGELIAELIIGRRTISARELSNVFVLELDADDEGTYSEQISQLLEPAEYLTTMLRGHLRENWHAFRNVRRKIWQSSMLSRRIDKAQAQQAIRRFGPRQLRQLVTGDVVVFFATNREVLNSPSYDNRYGRRSGALECGRAIVHVPPLSTRSRGSLPLPNLLQALINPDREDFVKIRKIEALSSREFMRLTRRDYRLTKQDGLLLFVHGYNNSFNDAMMRLAQVSHDMPFSGVPVLFSWPSSNFFHRYTADADVVTESSQELQRLLEFLATSIPHSDWRILGHSMGSRVVAQTLAGLSLTPRIAELAFVAPDISKKAFVGAMSAFNKSAKRTSLYASSWDLPLVLSRGVNARSRAGSTNGGIVTHTDLDSIDSSSVNPILSADLRHTYFANQSTVLDDLNELMVGGVAAELRAHLTMSRGRDYWEILP